MPRLRKDRYDQIIKDYESGMTQKEVGEKNGIGRDAVGNILRRFEVSIREYTGDRSLMTRKWFWDFDFFSKRNKVVAYWAGFMMADGCLISEGRMTRLTSYVQADDEHHMAQFLVDIGADKNVLSFREDGYVGFELNHKSLKNSLKSWGIIPRKTKKFVVPDICDDLLLHYLRGWFDGDGSMYRYGSGARFVINSGTLESLEWYKKSLIRLGYDGHLSFYESKAWPGNWKLYIGGGLQVGKIVELLMGDEEFKLDRKWNKYYSYYKHVPVTRN